MRVRRVVTGHDADGRSVVVSDAPAPRSHEYQHIGGMGTAIVWATRPGDRISPDGADPTPGLPGQLPAAGGSAFVMVRFPPDAVFADAGFDAAAADAEQRAVIPDLAALFEPDAPGMHVTPTVDYVIVLAGRIWLELDDGALVELAPGDTVVQNGTRHAWRNLGDAEATLGVIHLGLWR
jgi:mannose-6-phosphate isomerase-like protein (cupin superfamily)